MEEVIIWNPFNILILLAALSSGILIFLDAWKKVNYSLAKSIFWGFISFLLFPLTPAIYLIIRFLNSKADKLGL